MRSLGYTDEDALKIDVEVSRSMIQVVLTNCQYNPVLESVTKT
jgi:hypothetical protein